MGGCCCSSRKIPLHGRPVYYYCPPVSEEQEYLTSHDSVATAVAAGFLVGLNIDTSVPDTFRPPPAPIPFDVILGRSQSPDTEIAGNIISGSTFEKDSPVNLKESDCKTPQSLILTSPSPDEIGVEILKSKLHRISMTDEEDVCPTCLEEYDPENPKIVTKCNHHYHLSCILEWMERSDTCPICDQEMIYGDF